MHKYKNFTKTHRYTSAHTQCAQIDIYKEMYHVKGLILASVSVLFGSSFL